jgi:hypothetical protein
MSDESDGSELPDELPADQSLDFYEAIIERGRPNLDSVASALLEIHQMKLYRHNYPSFEQYVRERWNISRPRAYQLLKYARLRRMSTAVDTLPPNERQARLLDADGKVRKGPGPDLIQRAMGYLARTFFRLQVSECPEFIDAIRKLASEMEESFNQAKKASKHS